MSGIYSRALATGLIFGLLLIGCNVVAYMVYQKQMDDWLATQLEVRPGNLCIGVDTYFYLIIPTFILYIAGGIGSIVYARHNLVRQAHAIRVAALAGLLAALVSVAGVGLLIQTGVIPVRWPYGSWMVVYGMYAIGGIFLSMIAGALYYEYGLKKAKKGPV